MPPHGLAYRPAVASTRGIVTSGHALATMAGIEMLLQGGNAVDAAVATAAALNVVEPSMSGLAGCGVTLISSHRRQTRVIIDHTGVAPQGADPGQVRPEELKVGPKSVVTPGNLGGWLAALERFGTMPRAQVLAPAVRLAEDGFPLTLKNCDLMLRGEAQLAGSDEARRIVLGVGALRPNRRFVQTDLARTLREIGEGGVKAFHDGRVGRAITKAVQEAGGWLSDADLAACQPRWLTPLAGRFRDVELLVPPPPSSAWQILETLHILEDFDLKALEHNSAPYTARPRGSNKTCFGRSDRLCSHGRDATGRTLQSLCGPPACSPRLCPCRRGRRRALQAGACWGRSCPDIRPTS